MNSRQHSPFISCHRKSNLQAGFTLVELLTVIAVIAILAAILFPVIRSVRQKSNTMECASNLRQIHVALNLFANDNNGELPFLNDPGQELWGSKWQQRIEPYCSPESRTTSSATQRAVTESVYWCPSQEPHNPAQGWPGDYAINVLLFRANIFVDDPNGQQLPLRVQDIPDPSNFIFFVDGGGQWANPALYEAHADRIWARHSNPGDLKDGTTNAMFADGHVESADRAEFLQDRYWLFHESDSLP